MVSSLYYTLDSFLLPLWANHLAPRRKESILGCYILRCYGLDSRPNGGLRFVCGVWQEQLWKIQQAIGFII